MKLSQSSLVYKFVFFPAYLYFVASSSPILSAVDFHVLIGIIFTGSINPMSNGRLILPSKGENLSFCAVGWRLIFFPIVAVYTVLGLVVASTAFAVLMVILYSTLYACIAFIHVQKLWENQKLWEKKGGKAKVEDDSLGLRQTLTLWYRAKKGKYCPTVEIVP